jgi:hypothetical protein
LSFGCGRFLIDLMKEERMKKADNQRQVSRQGCYMVCKLKTFLKRPAVLRVLIWVLKIIFWISGEDTQAVDEVFKNPKL